MTPTRSPGRTPRSRSRPATCALAPSSIAYETSVSSSFNAIASPRSDALSRRIDARFALMSAGYSDGMEEENTQQRSSAAEKAAEVEEAYRKGEEKIKELENDPPKNLEDWPDDHAKYVTFGGPDGGHSYEEGPESKLGPSGLRHLPDGSVEIDGEKV